MTNRYLNVLVLLQLFAMITLDQEEWAGGGLIYCGGTRQTGGDNVGTVTVGEEMCEKLR